MIYSSLSPDLAQSLERHDDVVWDLPFSGLRNLLFLVSHETVCSAVFTLRMSTKAGLVFLPWARKHNSAEQLTGKRYPFSTG